jgi:U4/U6 small nuclear ribonucleoprotein SNU13
MEKLPTDSDAPRKLTKKIAPEKKEENTQKVTASPIADDKTTVKIFDMLE